MPKRPVEDFLSQEVEDLTRLYENRVPKLPKTRPITDRHAGGGNSISPLYLGPNAQEGQVSSVAESFSGFIIEEPKPAVPPAPSSTFSHGDGSPFSSARGVDKGGK